MNAETDVSLILTVLNEEESLPKFLDSLDRQERRPAEVVIVDGGSTDRTVEVLRDWGAATGMTTTVIVEAGANISRGRNLAIAHSTRPIVAVTDAGTELDRDWLGALVGAFDANTDVVSGFFRPVGDRFLGRLIAVTITPRQQEIDPATFLPSSRSVAFRRSSLEASSGYPEWLDYCEDLILDLELKAAGARFVFEPAAVVTWNARPTLRAFAKQYYRYARGDGKAGLFPRRHVLRYGAYAVGVVGLVVSTQLPIVLVPLAIGFLAYQSKFFGRVFHGRREFGALLPLALILVPVVVVVGDVAKMVGYPVGLRWKRKRNREQ